MAVAQVLVAGLGALLAWRNPRVRRLPQISAHMLRPVPLAVAILFALIAISALAYRPNNWDSMTYHLARVAHWILRLDRDRPQSAARRGALPGDGLRAPRPGDLARRDPGGELVRLRRGTRAARAGRERGPRGACAAFSDRGTPPARGWMAGDLSPRVLRLDPGG